MGIPQHYSRDIAQRCSALICHLRPVVQSGLPDDDRFGGPLDTTFLLAMATPMIVLPVERIFKPTRPGAEPPADDRELDPALADRVGDVLGPMQCLASAPFAILLAGGATWRTPNLSMLLAGGRSSFSNGFGSDAAIAEADRAPVHRILLDLRNALAHGGVAYLDAEGHDGDGQAVQLAFASARTKNGRVTALNILRIHQDHFCDFVLAWACWLGASPVADMINDQSPLLA